MIVGWVNRLFYRDSHTYFPFIVGIFLGGQKEIINMDTRETYKNDQN